MSGWYFWKEGSCLGRAQYPAFGICIDEPRYNWSADPRRRFARTTTTPLYQHQPPRSTASETVNSRQPSFCGCGSRHLEQTAKWRRRCKFSVNFSSTVKNVFYSGNHILI